MMNACALWWLLHLERVVDPLPAQPYLACNGGDVHLRGEEVMDLVIALYSLLMVLLTFLFLAFGHAGVPGDRGHRFLRGFGSRLSMCGFELSVFSQEVTLHRLGKVL